jgi:hypothetical protein
VTSVLGAVSVSSAVSAFGVMAHWAAHRRDSLGREKDLPVWKVSALVLVAVVAAVPGAQRKVEERRLAKAATQLVGHRVWVHCQDGAEAFVDAGSELGWVAFDADGVPQPRTLIKRDQCRFLKAYDKHPSDPSWDEMVAVHVLTHESMHMRGETSEAVAECEAVQRDEITAEAFGATPDQARALAQRYWRQVYPRMPDEYVTSDCRPGGPLDEGLATAPWY